MTPFWSWTTRQLECADIPKFMYHMRIDSDVLYHDVLASFDGDLRSAVSASLCGDLSDHSWWEAHHWICLWRPWLSHRSVCRSRFYPSAWPPGGSLHTTMTAYDTRTEEALAPLVTLSLGDAEEFFAQRSCGKVCSKTQ